MHAAAYGESAAAEAPDAAAVLRLRLAIACALSLLLHLLLIGVPVHPAGGMTGAVSTSRAPGMITARLEAPPAPPADMTSGLALDTAVTDISASPSEPAAPQVVAAPAAAPAPRDSPGLEIPSARDPRYYPAKELDTLPEALFRDPPPYPDLAANAGVREGHVKVLLLLDEFGGVNEASVVSADPAGYFEDAVVNYFRPKLFSPGRRAGLPVKSRLVIEINFEMSAAPRKN